METQRLSEQEEAHGPGNRTIHPLTVFLFSPVPAGDLLTSDSSICWTVMERSLFSFSTEVQSAGYLLGAGAEGQLVTLREEVSVSLSVSLLHSCRAL